MPQNHKKDKLKETSERLFEKQILDEQLLDERMLELTSLFEISKTLSSTLNLQAVLNTILLTPMGRMMISRGAVLLTRGQHECVIEALKGLPRELLYRKIAIDNLPARTFFTDDMQQKGIPWADFLTTYKLEIGFPIQSSSGTLGILVFGEKLSGTAFTEKNIDFLVSLSNLSATAIEKSLMFEKLREVNRKLDRSNQELNTLFEIGSEFNATFDVHKIIKLLGYALMGHLLVNKYAVFVKHNNRFILQGSQGYKDIQRFVENKSENMGSLNDLQTPFQITDTDPRPFAQILRSNMIKLIIPMKIQEETKGIICLGDKVNHSRYTDEEIEFLVTLANQAMISLENARLVDQMLEKQRIEEELSLAREIQNNLLPKHYPDIPGVEIEAVNIASLFVSGDYYDIIELNDTTQGIAIADVSGKGVPASLLMANLQATFRALAEVVVNPAHLVEKINNIIYKNTASEIFITLFYGRFNREALKLEYCNAGHNHPFVISEDGKIRYLDKGGLIIGMFPDFKYQKGTISLQQGDVLIMYTDGITEALNSDNEEFGEDRLLDVCKKNYNLSAKELKEAIVQAVRDFIGDIPQSDDVTLIILKMV